MWGGLEAQSEFVESLETDRKARMCVCVGGGGGGGGRCKKNCASVCGSCANWVAALLHMSTEPPVRASNGVVPVTRTHASTEGNGSRQHRNHRYCTANLGWDSVGVGVGGEANVGVGGGEGP